MKNEKREAIGLMVARNPGLYPVKHTLLSDFS